MRRTFKGIAFNKGIPDEMSAYLIGHVPPGQSAAYAQRRALLAGKALRRMQREMSAELMRLCGTDATREPIGARIAPTPREVARAAGLLRYRDHCDVHGQDKEHSVATGRCVACVSERNAQQRDNRRTWQRKQRKAGRGRGKLDLRA